VLTKNLILVPYSFEPVTTRMTALKIADPEVLSAMKWYGHISGSLPPADIDF
jgi:hypothetical protein